MSLLTLDEIRTALPYLKERNGKFHGECPACQHARFNVFKGSKGDWIPKCHRVSCPGAIEAIRDILATGKAHVVEHRPEPAKAPPKPWRGPGPGRTVVARYDYTDAQGRSTGTKLRIEPGRDGRTKDFVWLHGADLMGRPSADRHLYRLQAIAADPTATVLIVEGEKCVHALDGRLPAGIVATCPSDGAGSPAKPYLDQLRGRNVVMLPDNDVAGESFCSTWSTALHRIARTVRVLPLDGTQGIALDDGDDIVEWLEAGGDIGDLLAPADGPPEWVTDDIEHDPPPVDDDPEDARPIIELRVGKYHEVIDHAERALIAASVNVFQQGGRLVVISKGEPPWRTRRLARDNPASAASPYYIRGVTPPMLQALYSRHLRFFGWDARAEEMRPRNPPKDISAMHCAGPAWTFPALRAIAPHPIMLDDGTIITQEGYYEPFEIYIAPGNLAYPPMPEAPTQADAFRAYSDLTEPFQEFPFVEPGDWAAVVAALLTVLYRLSINGDRPLFLITSSTRGTGKSRIPKLIGLIVLGREPESDSPTSDPDEEKKRLLSYAIGGCPMLNLDNIADSLGNPVLDALLTMSTISGRILGTNTTVTADNTITLFATGNNPVLAGDTARRTIEIRIDSGEERPEDRTFKRDWTDLEAWVMQHRGRLLTAAFTLLRAHALAGSPTFTKAIGSYEAWDRTIRQAVLWASGEDPCHRQRAQTPKDIHPELADLFDAISAVPTLVQGRWSARDLIDKSDASPALHDALSNLPGNVYRAGEFNAKSIGKFLAKNKDRVIAGFRLVCEPDRDGKMAYKLVRTKQAALSFDIQ